MAHIIALKRLRLEDFEFEANLVYMVGPCLRKKEKKKNYIKKINIGYFIYFMTMWGECRW